jgi:hypothetical protein
MRIIPALSALLLLSSACIVDLDVTSPDFDTAPDTTISFTRSVTPSAKVTIQNGNGAIDVVESADNLVHVTAIERLHGSPAARIQVEETASALTVCTLYDSFSRCADGTRSNGSRVEVTYLVSVPRNQQVLLVTGNGAITAVTAGARVDATTGNGDVGITVRGTTTGSEMTLTTGNGSIRVTLPGGYNGRVDATTGNGAVHSELPITTEGSFDSRRLRGTLGAGGALIRMTTGNGQLELRKGE